ncbi:DinB family protein [Cohnella herbarum]|uniref:DinB family protein n=1 Tax=Cohnella herbarum TaxID=2728023 RepID=A0A7Z2ZNS2_9BACL|nr:DinB family protein [Cohnella herbarum]QJD86135.1 DinB family protein [Cohnella herbarum]
MEHFLFKQLAFVRGQTFKAMEGVSEEIADRIPEGFRNSIRWNLGHIYVVLERFAFLHANLPLLLPEGFKERFESGTSPLTSQVSFPAPSLQQLETLLKDQQERIREALAPRIHEQISPPYTTSAGMTLGSIDQFLSFNLYHEGMHLNAIKNYKRLL